MNSPTTNNNNNNNNNSTFALFLDIDGVLMKDSKAIPCAHEALSNVKGVPIVFVSNGGGRTEEVRAKQLAKELSIAGITADQFILPHTPMKAIVPELNSSTLPVILVGRSERAIQVSKSLGLQNCVLLQDLVKTRPFLFPMHQFPPPGDGDGDGDVVVAAPNGCCSIFVVEEPDDWGEALQLCVDILRCPNGRLPSFPHDTIDPISSQHKIKQSVPVYVANPDFTYSGECSLVRFTVGAFLHCLHELFIKLVGWDFESQVFGKPHLSTYEFAKNALKLQQQQQQQQQNTPNSKPTIKTIYAIGDNPSSDIRGARNASKVDQSVQWISILVRTGCFQGIGNDLNDPADIVTDDISSAIDTILRIEKSKEIQCEPSESGFKLFQRCTGINDKNELIKRAVSIRDRAVLIHPYLCISRFRFLEPRISTHPFINQLKSRFLNHSQPKTTPITFLDVGCCCGTDIRELITNGTINLKQGDDIIGIDINEDLINLGFDLYQDKQTLGNKFFVLNMLDIKSIRELKFENRFDVIYSGSVLHLLCEDDCKAMVTNIFNCLKHKKENNNENGGIFFGRIVGVPSEEMRKIRASKIIVSSSSSSSSSSGHKQNGNFRNWLKFLHTPDSLNKLFIDAGFKSVEIEIGESDMMAGSENSTDKETSIFMQFTAKC